MASYIELYNLSFNADLVAKVTAAVAVAADTIRAEDPATTNHTYRLNWAAKSLANPDGMARQIMWLLLAQNKDYTVAQIEGASDAQIQSAVNGAIQLLW